MTQTSQPGPARPVPSAAGPASAAHDAVPSAADLSAAGLPGPIERPRRLRAGAAMRSLVREHTLRPADLVLPMFVREGASENRPEIGRAHV